MLLIPLLLVSCENVVIDGENLSKDYQVKKKISIQNVEPYILTVDECQYVLYKENEGTNREHGYMSHKGDCINPIHIYKHKTLDSNESVHIELNNKILKGGKERK